MVGRFTLNDYLPARRSATTEHSHLKSSVGHSVPVVDLMSKDRAELQKPLAGAPRFVREVSTQAGRPFRHVVAIAVGQRAAEGRCRRALRTAPFRPSQQRANARTGGQRLLPCREAGASARASARRPSKGVWLTSRALPDRLGERERVIS